MSNWNLGYVSDVEYVGSFYGEQAPVVLDFTCLLNGIVPPVTNGRYTYCELGCGLGLTTTCLAAANPDAEFYGVDFNPAHIARARVLSDEAGLENLTFLESGFDELVEVDASALPMFDYVTLHGVYSWVNSSIRADIVRFLRRHLKPGGVVYLSYNCMPGWSLGVGIQRLLHEVGSRASGGAEQRVESAIRFAEKMSSVGAGFLGDNPFMKTVLDALASGDRRYLAHEYLNAGWRALFFSDVAEDLDEAKLGFVGSAKVIENFQDLLLKAEQRNLLGQIDDRILREVVKDFCTPRRLRRDVFVRGQRRMTVRERELRLNEILMVLKVPRSRVTFTISVPQGEATVNEEVYGPIFDALADGPKTLGELVSLDAVAGNSDARPAEVAGMLIGSGQVMPAVAGAGSDDAAKRYNLAISKRARVLDTKARECFAVPMFGTGVDAGIVDRLCYAAIADGVEADAEALVPHVWGPIRDRGEAMNQDGQRVEGEAQNCAIISEMASQFLSDRMPLLKLTGAM